MRSRILQYQCLTSMDRNTALSLVLESISDAGGWVSQHSLFSNLAATINFELPAESLEIFSLTLHKAGLSIKPVNKMIEQQRGDVTVSLSLTFSGNEPDMKRDVPPFG